jgi:hypothetical protein
MNRCIKSMLGIARSFRIVLIIWNQTIFHSKTPYYNDLFFILWDSVVASTLATPFRQRHVRKLHSTLLFMFEFFIYCIRGFVTLNPVRLSRSGFDPADRGKAIEGRSNAHDDREGYSSNEPI